MMVMMVMIVAWNYNYKVCAVELQFLFFVTPIYDYMFVWREIISILVVRKIMNMIIVASVSEKYNS